MPATSLDQIISLAKRRGFIFQSSEIYGGAAASYDYGPLGVALKNNIKAHWWKTMTQGFDNIVGLDAAIMMHPKVWEASGHVSNFTDPLVECQQCHKRFRVDHLLGDDKYLPIKDDADAVLVAVNTKGCPGCGAKNKFTTPRQFNLMFTTNLGAVENEGSTVYLRPETAQGIYVNAQLVANAMRLKVPFGIAQIGKAFRNEVTPGNFTFRTVEFEQMEMQYFVKPADADKVFEFWKTERSKWYASLGFDEKMLRFHEHGKGELAHYAKAAFDIEYKMPFGWKEIEGIHNRGDWDLKRHSEFSGKDLSFFDEETKEKYLPWIIETSVGADRVTLAILSNALCEENKDGEQRLVLRLPKVLAPVQVAIFPLLSNNDDLVKKAREIATALRGSFRVQFDESGSIGRRYRRQDEIGTPFCITVDHDSLNDQSVTVRERDSMEQKRVSITELNSFFTDQFSETL
ncbi:MAG: glycine--tRNA ligase [bacterium]|nr:glycine--tRNA ligase [bacterium]